MRQLVGEIGEKLVELGQNVSSQAKQQVVKGLVQTTQKQILGEPQKAPAGQKDDFAAMLGELKSLSPAALAEAKKQDLAKKEAGIEMVQKQLQVEILKRKEAIDSKIQQVRQQKQQEIPKYLSGKPGEARTLAEKEELWQKEQKELEKKKKEKELAAAVKQFQGSGEVGKFTVG